MLILVIAGVVIALIFDFLNGMNDAANSIATIVSTRVLTPLAAVAWAAFFNFAAYFVFGVHVANTIGKGIVDPHIINEYFVLCALIGSVLWVYLCTHFGLPISVSHSLIGGMIGPALFVEGTGYLISSGIWKIVLFIFVSPLIGMVLGFFMMAITLFIFRHTNPLKVDRISRTLQLVSSAFFSLGHGSNDAQKTMGIIAVLLFSTGYLGSEFYVPEWVVISSYSAISLGTLLGGWKVIKTMGMGLTDLRPVGGFCAETAGALTLVGTALAGIPVSTTHTITGAIIGVGVTRRTSAVRWGTASHIVAAWVLTIPASMIVSGLLYLLVHTFVM